MPVVILTIVLVASIVICHQVARARNASPVFWVVMALIFGPFAIPFVFFARSRAGHPDS